MLICFCYYQRISMTEIEVTCSPSRFGNVISKLSEDQKEAIRELGFGCMLLMHPVKVRRLLCLWLAEAYDSQTRRFKIEDTFIPISLWDVHCLMGIPTTGQKIEIMENKPNKTLQSLYMDPTKGAITLSYLAKCIEEKSVADEHFIRRFMLLMIGTILAPNAKNEVRPCFLNIIEDVSCIQTFNWADFTLEYLLDSLALYKSQESKYLRGNLALLQVFILFYLFQSYMHLYYT